MASLWKIEKCAAPTAAYAAEAIEIIDGEPMRRVSLSQLDLTIYEAHKSGEGAIETLAIVQALPVAEVMASLRRLHMAGLVLDAPTIARA